MTALLLASDRARTPLFMLASLGNVPTAFNPYGYRPACAGASTPMTGYVGQPREPALGWYLLGNGHRVYSPVVRRFLDRVPGSGVTEPTEGALRAKEDGHRGSWLTLSLRT